MSEKCLVAGGCGFIGSHLCNFLKERGYYVRVVDIKPESQCYLPLKADEVLQLDLRKFENAKKAVRDMQHVYQLSASMGGMGFIATVHARVMHDNVKINANMLEASRLSGVERYFFSSSACVYPVYKQKIPDSPPLKESDVLPADPNEAYGYEKLFAEKMCEAYLQDYGLQVRIARFFNTYGDYGTYRGGREKAPAALCRKVAMAKDGGSITVWGDGKATRSYLYVSDNVEAVHRLMLSDFTNPINVGSEELVTVDELADMIIEISGKQLKKKHDLSKPEGVRGRDADITLAKKVLGWQPKVGLREGIEKTYRWIEQMVKSEV